MKCPKCGAPIREEDDKFCSKCGYALDKKISPEKLEVRMEISKNRIKSLRRGARFSFILSFICFVVGVIVCELSFVIFDGFVILSVVLTVISFAMGIFEIIYASVLEGKLPR